MACCFPGCVGNDVTTKWRVMWDTFVDLLIGHHHGLDGLSSVFSFGCHVKDDVAMQASRELLQKMRRHFIEDLVMEAMWLLTQ